MQHLVNLRLLLVHYFILLQDCTNFNQIRPKDYIYLADSRIISQNLYIRKNLKKHTP